MALYDIMIADKLKLMVYVFCVSLSSLSSSSSPKQDCAVSIFVSLWSLSWQDNGLLVEIVMIVVVSLLLVLWPVLDEV